MQEAFLHFIWQHQYFNKTGLVTCDGVPVNILHPGHYNTDAGPDFKEAKIDMEGMEWRGHVELHIKSSDWGHHRHHEDDAYNNVILHVVWSHDKEIKRKDNTLLPTVELQGLIEEQLIFGYKRLVNSPLRIPCERQLKSVNAITWIATLDKTLMERLSAKAALVKELLNENNQDWEETAYQLLAKNFGFKINSEPFLTLAQSLPYKILRKHAQYINQIEALLFGQAGFLEEDTRDVYQKSLLREYEFLRHKYELRQRLSSFQWKRLRLRPPNFPAVRLAQFARTLHRLPSLFKNFIEIGSVKVLKQHLKIAPSAYWEKHYQFGKTSKKTMPSLGNASIENIAVNTVVPLLVAYGQYVDDVTYIDKAVALLQEVKAEKNRITGYWETLDAKVTTAFDSQALIQLYNEYCSKRRCLSCNVGAALIRKK